MCIIHIDIMGLMDPLDVSSTEESIVDNNN